MTPEELQRVLRTEGDAQRYRNQLMFSNGWPAFVFMIVAGIIILYVYGDW